MLGSGEDAVSQLYIRLLMLRRLTRYRRLSGALPVRRRDLDVFVADLDPEHEGLRIAHLSDVHCGGVTSRQQVRNAVEIANQARPDLIVLTGDYVSRSIADLALLRRDLAGLHAAPVFATLGNHDHWVDSDRVASVLRGLGYQTLRNQSESLTLRGSLLHVIGLDDPVSKHHNIDEAFREVSEGGTRVVLAHCGRVAPDLAPHGVDLLLAGHTHAGQIRIPVLTDILGRRRGCTQMRGIKKHDQMTVYVTSGVGNVAFPLRLGHGTHAEVAVITLRAA
jgi:predicted MPP superfamily phosphohydrolase